MLLLRRCQWENVENCWNHAKILPMTVVATGPDDAVSNELAALLLKLPDIRLRIEDVVVDVTELWTAASLESEEEDAEYRAAIQNSEPDEEDGSRRWCQRDCDILDPVLG